MNFNRIMPLIAAFLVIGIAGSLYLYNETRADLRVTLLDSEQTSAELLSLTESFEAVSAQIEALSQSNSQLEARIAELETEPDVPPVIVEKPDIVLDVTAGGDVRNVILLIGDGMGVGQLTAAEAVNGDEGLVMRSLPYKSLVTTYSVSGYVTDSAASATALATGYKTSNGAISMSSTGEVFTTVVEFAEALGMSTGVVTNTRVTHATPACFMAHVSNRGSETTIAQQVLASGVDVILGGGSTYFSSLDPARAGYTVVATTSELMNVDSDMVLGLFNADYMSYDSLRDPLVEPSVAEMTRKSIELLSGDPDGFFLMVEGGRIDHASHDNNFDLTMGETFAFDAAVLEALKYASGRNDTLVVVTADHETGGLLIIGGYTTSGTPQYKWIGDDHTGSMVPVYAYGPMAEMVIGFSDNTDIGRFLISVIE
ncbi:MAG: alkaline phosphatase [Candidatus Bathyarchaeota archaeon]